MSLDRLIFMTLSLGSSAALNALSHQTSSHYILANGLRTAWPPEHFDQVQSSGRRSLFRKFVAHPRSLYYVQEVRTQFEPIRTNVLRTSLV